MASTNKTTNYELSQYIGSDKPTYLGDYNNDMLKIDTAMKGNADKGTANESAISVLQQNILTFTGEIENLNGRIDNLNARVTVNEENINLLNQKGYCKAVRSSQYTIASPSTSEKVALDTFQFKKGNFTFENGGVRIGAGIHTILVNGSAYYYNNVSNSALLSTIVKQNTTERVSANLPGVNYMVVGTPSSIIEVNEGDIIYLNVRANQGTPTIQNTYNTTFLNIVVID